MLIKTIQWKENKIILLDQRKLPHEEVYLEYEDYESLARAIEIMVVRGAPAIGVAAAYGVALGSFGIGVKTFAEFFDRIAVICDRLASTRPTAVNLSWALERMKKCVVENAKLPLESIKQKLKEEAVLTHEEDISNCKKMGEFGAALFSDGDNVLTHCNAGGLATGGFGTALGVLYTAEQHGKSLSVYADETRPRLQGASLTAWELQKYGVHVTVITDNMAASLMKAGKVDKIIVGADRIAKNGDVANKIGTYSLAVLAHYHKIPFYVAAPLSTFDRNAKTGEDIPIEERAEQEVSHIGSFHVTPKHVSIYNPAFDVTPHGLITAIITEKGILEAPFVRSISELF
ncbi:MAG: S-methyl-5-thioribose-1-phosphate isomerase [Deltaproteobacteria bacterium CG_4_10_14_0_2_um_filter_43_8]|nr:MAG: S-methyl-5-thioribose-1-phosphate isomerase [Deltaproteobacteria bacterium CG11_big_fil_rev_8_21_14_0_20_42_23]PJA20990.1 MAG: S-methyl-5-thioribose-1-phosphate isomerase [Deltaproteobacteria bacterium CG_4_10_14_0_2_um_filter_43_8]PJC63678.1 MAG: S-methyl-5-thioribose-1-phosphate isomerase [Deltaproteobacteria bacterium CG_4_9_14_0_2_um_filter_42_21]